MRHLLGIIALGLAFSACATRKESKQAKEPTPEAKALEERQSAGASAGSALKDFEANKATYVTNSENAVADLESKISAFRASAPTDPSSRETYMANVTSLEDNLNQTKTRLQAVRDADVKDWDKRQRDLEQSLMMTRSSYDAAVQAAH